VSSHLIGDQSHQSHDQHRTLPSLRVGTSVRAGPGRAAAAPVHHPLSGPRRSIIGGGHSAGTGQASGPPAVQVSTSLGRFKLLPVAPQARCRARRQPGVAPLQQDRLPSQSEGGSLRVAPVVPPCRRHHCRTGAVVVSPETVIWAQARKRQKISLQHKNHIYAVVYIMNMIELMSYVKTFSIDVEGGESFSTARAGCQFVPPEPGAGSPPPALGTRRHGRYVIIDSCVISESCYIISESFYPSPYIRVMRIILRSFVIPAPSCGCKSVSGLGMV
jgi:hypothetical protein